MVTGLTIGGAAGTLALLRALAAIRDQVDSPVAAVALFTALGMWDDEALGASGGAHRRNGSRLGRTSITTDLARAHLMHGEWLRRERRRGDL